MARVEFSIPAELGRKYAYLLGNFNAFNEGSFRMKRKGDRWRVTLRLPEGVWYYGFSVDGNFCTDPENPETTVYRRISYKFERTLSVATIIGPGEVFHVPSATYLYSIAGRTHVLLRARRGKIRKVRLVLDESEVPMKRKAFDELFEYYEAILPGEGTIRYSLIVESENETLELGPFEAEPYRQSAPEWVYGRVFYQIMPDRFRASNREGLRKMREAIMRHRFHGGDLAGIIRRLDHIENLGVNALYLTPIFESMTYHRYDVTDYFRIDGKLGGWGVFRKLVQELKKRDIRLILDGVFHHTSFFHPYFQDVVRAEEGSEYRGFYRITGFPVVPEQFLRILHSEEPWTERYHLIRSLDWNYESFYSVWLMPRLNHDSPEVMTLIREVMGYWLESADGWRLDVAHGVPPELWREMRKAMPEEAYLVGEVMDDPRLWLFDAFHGAMNYLLYELILRFFVEGEIDAGDFLNGLELLSAYLGPAEYAMYNFLDNHDTERFLDLVGDKRRYLCALAFLMTYKGIPSIFYGDEIGLRGRLDGGLSAGRASMVWDRGKWDTEIFETTKRLIRLRRRSRALQLGEFVPVRFQGRTMIYERVLGDERVRVEIRYSMEPEDCAFHVTAL